MPLRAKKTEQETTAALSEQILRRRYLGKDKRVRVIETPLQMVPRIIKAGARHKQSPKGKASHTGAFVMSARLSFAHTAGNGFVRRAEIHKKWLQQHVIG